MLSFPITVRASRLGGVVPALAIAVLATFAPVASAVNNGIDGVDPELQASAQEQSLKLAGKLGLSLTKLHLAVGWARFEKEVPNGLTGTNTAINGPIDMNGPICEIAINKPWFNPIAPYEKEEILAHEVFHCFEKEIAPDNGEENDWISEGLARWVDLTLFPATHLQVALASLTNYYASPGKSLFSRRYDSVGFWAHVQDVYGDLWERIPAIVRAGIHGQNQAAFDAAVSDEASFLSSWGSSAFDLAGEDTNWLMSSPFPGRQWPEGSASVPAPEDVDGTSHFELRPYSTAQLKIVPRADKPLIEIHLGEAYGRFGVEQNYVDEAIGDKLFCSAANPAECACPPGDEGAVPPLTPLPSNPLLGLAAGRLGGGASIRYLAPQDSSYCKPKEPKSPEEPLAPTTTTASSFGDPHLLGFGGTALEFQAAGEFTLVKSTTTDDLEVQARQQPESSIVSVDTAVAMRVGHAIVEVDRPVNDQSLSVYVNHRLTHAKSIELAGGGSVKLLDLRNAGFGGRERFPGVKVTWHDGTYVEIPENYVGLSLLVKVARDRLGHLTGLLGDAGVPAATQFRGREGKPYSPTTLEQDEKVLYRSYGASWRISQRFSLFTYPRHKNTNSYTILDFPKKLFNEGGVPLAKALHAEAICRAAGITNLALLQACEYDVLVTGKPGYAAGDGLVQAVSEPGPTLSAAATGPTTTTLGPLGVAVPPSEGAPGPSTPSPPPAIDLGAGYEQPSVAYDASSGDTYVAWQDPVSDSVIDLCVVPSGASSCNGGTGPYKLVDKLAGSGAVFFAVKLLVAPGGTVVVLANIEGVAAAAEPAGYTDSEGVVAWSSAAGGAAFATAGQGIATNGKLLAEAPGYMPGAGAVALNSTDFLTYGNSYPFGNGATDFSLTTPAPSTTPVVDHKQEFGNRGSVDGSQLAAEEYPAKSGKYVVVTVGSDLDTPAGCPAGSEEGTGYGVGSGTPEALQKQTAWSSSYFKVISCPAEAAVLTGGGQGHAGIGAVQSEGAGLNGAGADGISYLPFNLSSDTFGAPVSISEETPFTLLGAEALSASEDSAGGLYACWVDDRGVMLASSSDDGASWQPAEITGIEAGANPVVLGTSPGLASIAYTSSPGGGETQEYLAPSL